MERGWFQSCSHATLSEQASEQGEGKGEGDAEIWGAQGRGTGWAVLQGAMCAAARASSLDREQGDL